MIPEPTNVLYCTDHFALPLPPGHRFPASKYARLRERLAGSAADLFRVADAATDRELALAHDPRYIDAVCNGTLSARALQRLGFPWSTALVLRSRRSTGATLAACRSALDGGAAANLAGGTHHAHRAHGAGFCVFNDAAVAARAMQAEGRIERAVIIDLDVHQGDGTAAIFEADPTIYTFSMHGRDNYPFRKARSDLDIDLCNGTDDRGYLATLQAALSAVLARSRPQLAIYLAGADPFVGDRLGRLALTKSGLAARDRMVFDALERQRIPVAVAMAGGYADAIDDVVDIHVATVTEMLVRCAGRHMPG